MAYETTWQERLKKKYQNDDPEDVYLLVDWEKYTGERCRQNLIRREGRLDKRPITAYFTVGPEENPNEWGNWDWAQHLLSMWTDRGRIVWSDQVRGQSC